MAKNGIDAIKKKLAEHKEELARQYHLKEMGIFGSYSTGNAGKDSDIDVLVEFSKVPDLSFVSLELALEKLLGKRVDLVRKKTLKPALRSRILKEVIPI